VDFVIRRDLLGLLWSARSILTRRGWQRVEHQMDLLIAAAQREAALLARLDAQEADARRLRAALDGDIMRGVVCVAGVACAAPDPATSLPRLHVGPEELHAVRDGGGVLRWRFAGTTQTFSSVFDAILSRRAG
jgi:hypothetical protein